MNRKAIFFNSLAFVIGFTAIFSIVGILLQTVLSSIAYDAVTTMRILGGIVILTLGILLLASLKYTIPFLTSEHKPTVHRFRNSYLTSFIFGVAFAISWTPCVGFLLGAIYTLAATSPNIAFALLLVYSLGLGLPFLLAGLFFSQFSTFIEKSRNALRYMSALGGIFLIIIGILIVTNYLGALASFFLPAEDMLGEEKLSFVTAFFAGILTFLSPCILPLIPAFLSYMAGTTAIQAKRKK